jgi:hypothetical protein
MGTNAARKRSAAFFRVHFLSDLLVDSAWQTPGYVATTNFDTVTTIQSETGFTSQLSKERPENQHDETV